MAKLISYLSVLVFSLVLYNEVLAPQVSADSSKPVTVEESMKIFDSFGGKKGEVPVTIFVTSWCPVCTALEKTFKGAGISFAKADIESNPEAMLFYAKLVAGRPSGVPATLVGQDVFMGYDTKNIVNAIKKLRLEKDIKKIDLHNL